MFCEKCGCKLRENACFCENCGTKISKSDSEEKEIYNNYEVSYKINRIKNFPKILIISYIIEFTAIIIACIFPIAYYYNYNGMGTFGKINISVKFLIIAAIFLILGIVINKKIILHIITVILYFFRFIPGMFRYSRTYIMIEDTGATDVYYISAALMLISLIIVIIYGIYRRKTSNK